MVDPVMSTHTQYVCEVEIVRLMRRICDLIWAGGGSQSQRERDAEQAGEGDERH